MKISWLSHLKSNSIRKINICIEYQMQKKMLRPSLQAFPKRPIKKSKSRLQLFRHSSSSSVIFEQKNQSTNQLSSLNLQFPSASKETSKENTLRIHSSKGNNKGGEKNNLRKYFHQSKQNVLQIKDSDYSFTNSSKNVSLKVLYEQTPQTVLLGIKSFHPQQQKEQRKRYNSPINKKQTQYVRDLGLKQKQKQTKVFSPFCNSSAEQLFRELNRKMQQQKELTATKSKNKNCFYFNLKNKLKKQIIRISSQKSRDHCKLLIHGCEEKKHRRIHSASKASTERASPLNAKSVTSSGLYTFKAQNKIERPNSCQTSRNQVEYFKNFTTQPQSPKNNLKRQRNTLKEKQTEKRYIANNNLTFDGQQKESQKKRQKRQANQCKQQNQRLISILNQCSNYQNIYSALNTEMKAFQYYCKKIDVGMKKASNLLVDLQDNDSFED